MMTDNELNVIEERINDMRVNAGIIRPEALALLDEVKRLKNDLEALYRIERERWQQAAKVFGLPDPKGGAW